MKNFDLNGIKTLNSTDIRNLISMEDAIIAMEEAFKSFSDGTSTVPMRHITDINDLNLFFKPAYNKILGRISVKIITQKVNGNLPGSPTIKGMVLLLDMKTGDILAMMDGASITALRTGAAGGMATKLLAGSNVDTVAVFGCGTQGKALLEAVCEVRPIKRALLFDKNHDASKSFKLEFEEKMNISMQIQDDLENLKDAGVICTATNSQNPLFNINDISEGTHINAIGSYKPNMQELDPEIIKYGKLYVDSKDAVLKESGDLIKPISDNAFTNEIIKGEIGEVISNKIEGRTNDNEITVFKSVGLGVQDLFMANMIYERFLQI